MNNQEIATNIENIMIDLLIERGIHFWIDHVKSMPFHDAIEPNCRQFSVTFRDGQDLENRRTWVVKTNVTRNYDVLYIYPSPTKKVVFVNYCNPNIWFGEYIPAGKRDGEIYQEFCAEALECQREYARLGRFTDYCTVVKKTDALW